MKSWIALNRFWRSWVSLMTVNLTPTTDKRPSKNQAVFLKSLLSANDTPIGLISKNSMRAWCLNRKKPINWLWIEWLLNKRCRNCCSASRSIILPANTKKPLFINLSQSTAASPFKPLRIYWTQGIIRKWSMDQNFPSCLRFVHPT